MPKMAKNHQIEGSNSGINGSNGGLFEDLRYLSCIVVFPCYNFTYMFFLESVSLNICNVTCKTQKGV